MEKQNQAELDSGERMMLTEQEYRVALDSMLNVVYKDLMTRLNEAERVKLRTEQLEWIEDRDREFLDLWKPLNEMTKENGFAPQDFRMRVYHQEAVFIKNRILELIDQFGEE